MNIPVPPHITTLLCPETHAASGCLSEWNTQHLLSSRSLPASTAPGPLLQEAFLGLYNSLASLTLGTLTCKHHAIAAPSQSSLLLLMPQLWGKLGPGLGRFPGNSWTQMCTLLPLRPQTGVVRRGGELRAGKWWVWASDPASQRLLGQGWFPVILSSWPPPFPKAG